MHVIHYYITTFFREQLLLKRKITFYAQYARRINNVQFI
jgi:hypothetical protein